MEFSRPDLSSVNADVRAYIESLEAEIERLKRPASRPRRREEPEEAEGPVPEIFEPAEPETTINVITATASGVAKRTPRHHYHRQRRGGMGVFDLETQAEDPPKVLALADESDNLLLITNLARAFRLPVSAIPEAPVRSRGESIVGRLNLLPEEQVAALLPDQAQGYLVLVSQRGYVRLLRHHVFGEYMKPGTNLYDAKNFGPLAAAAWTSGDADLFLSTRQGKAIRFAVMEKSLPPQGGLGIRLSDGDQVVGVTSVYPDSGVFLLGENGKGTIRLMEGFAANKSPGAGGKIAMNADDVIFAERVEEDDDIFILSRLSKIIRFTAGQVPAKDSVVQGVICMTLRGDDCIAAAVNPANPGFSTL